MRLLVQRSLNSKVEVEGKITGSIDFGLVVLVGFEENDTEKDIDYFATFYNGKCYLIHINDCGSTKTLRFNLPANGIVSTINLAKDYEIQEAIKTI